MEFLLGSASIVSSQFQLPLLAAYCGTKAVKAVVRRRRQETDDGILGADLENGVTLKWTDLHLTMEQRTPSRTTTRQILSGVSGTAHPGRLLVVMGPSASGKVKSPPFMFSKSENSFRRQAC